MANAKVKIEFDFITALDHVDAAVKILDSVTTLNRRGQVFRTVDLNARRRELLSMANELHRLWEMGRN
jgi:hypothetical protein